MKRNDIGRSARRRSRPTVIGHSLALAAAFAIVLCASPLAGEEQPSADTQSSFEDSLFGGSQDGSEASAFDASAASGERAETQYFVGGSVLVSTTATIPAENSAGASVVTATAGTSGKIFGKVTVPDYGSLFVSYAATYPFFQGYSGGGTAPTAADSSGITYALSEFHYSFDVGKKVFVRLGRQLIAWGPSQVWTPVDFINGEKANAFADLDTRTGKNGLRIHVPLGTANAFAFADFSGMTASGSYGDPVETVNAGGRLDFTAADFEFGLTAYGGKHAAAKFGADFSGRAFGTTVYGELALAPGMEPADTGVQASLGFSRTLDELKRWTLSAEGFYNSRGKDYTGYTVAALVSAIPAGERMLLYQSMFYAYAALSADKLFSNDLSTTLMALANLQDGSYWVRLSEAFSLPRLVPFTVSASYYGGGENRELTRYTGGNAIAFTVSTKISF